MKEVKNYIFVNFLIFLEKETLFPFFIFVNTKTN